MKHTKKTLSKKENNKRTEIKSSFLIQENIIKKQKMIKMIKKVLTIKQTLDIIILLNKDKRIIIVAWHVFK